jgi:hypothetical protein
VLRWAGGRVMLDYGTDHPDTDAWYDPAADTVHSGHPGQDPNAHGPNGTNGPNGPNEGRQLRPVRASRVQPRRLRWLWHRRVPVGGLALLAGREGLGKSTLAVDLAAHITRGDLPGERHGQPANVVYIASEDSRDHVIVPRLLAAGADLNRVIFLDALDDDGFEDRLVLPLDTLRLAEVVDEHDVALVVLDAATSVIDGRLDGDKDRQMRQALEAIGRMADRTGTAVLGIVHFGKRQDGDTGKLILGTIAWSQVARSVLAVAPDDEGNLVVSTTKANLAPGDTPSLAASLVETFIDTPDGPTSVGRIKWNGETAHNARDFLGDTEEHADRDEAVEWLTGYLIDNGGSAKASDALKAAKADGIAERTLKRARPRAGVSSKREGFGQGAVWSLDPADSHSCHSGRSGHSGHAQTHGGTDGTNAAPEED